MSSKMTSFREATRDRSFAHNAKTYGPLCVGVVGSGLFLYALQAGETLKSNVGLNWMMKKGDIDEEAVERMMNAIDINHDNEISFKEFCDGIKRFLSNHPEYVRMAEPPPEWYDPSKEGAKEAADERYEQMCILAKARAHEKVETEMVRAWKFLDTDGDKCISRAELARGMRAYNTKIQGEVRKAENYGVLGLALLAGSGVWYAYRAWSFLNSL